MKSFTKIFNWPIMEWKIKAENVEKIAMKKTKEFKTLVASLKIYNLTLRCFTTLQETSLDISWRVKDIGILSVSPYKSFWIFVLKFLKLPWCHKYWCNSILIWSLRLSKTSVDANYGCVCLPMIWNIYVQFPQISLIPQTT